jgi:hypothetical protein
MSYRLLKLFSLKTSSENIISYFDNFLNSKKVNNCSYQIEHGFYKSNENRNKGYNYILKVIVDDDIEEFKLEMEKEYTQLLRNINPFLKEEEVIFSLEYEPFAQFTHKIIQKSQINHIVFIPFKESCSKEDITNSFSRLQKLFDNLEGMQSFCYGKCINKNSDKNYVFEIEFSSEISRNNYLSHEEHIKVAEFIIPLLQDGEKSIIAFDYLLKEKPKKLPNLQHTLFSTSGVDNKKEENSASSLLYRNHKI